MMNETAVSAHLRTLKTAPELEVKQLFSPTGRIVQENNDKNVVKAQK